MSQSDLVLEAQSVKLMFQIIDQITESVKMIEKMIEKQLAELTEEDEMCYVIICRSQQVLYRALLIKLP